MLKLLCYFTFISPLWVGINDIVFTHPLRVGINDSVVSTHPLRLGMDDSVVLLLDGSVVLLLLCHPCLHSGWGRGHLVTVDCK